MNLVSFNNFLIDIFTSIENLIFSNLDNILFINTDIINDFNFKSFLGPSVQNGLLLISKSLFLGLLLFFILNYVLSHLIYVYSESPQSFIFKSLIFLPCINSSLWICEKIIYIFSILTNIINELIFEIIGSEISFSNLILKITSWFENFNFFTLDGILITLIMIELFSVFIFYSIRYITCKILILLSPFAFLSLINDKTSFLFKTWLQLFISLLFTQIIVLIVLFLSFSFDFYSGDIISKITFLSLIIVISKCYKNLKHFFSFSSYCKSVYTNQ